MVPPLVPVLNDPLPKMDPVSVSVLPPVTSIDMPVPFCAEISPLLTMMVWLAPYWPEPRTVWLAPMVCVPPYNRAFPALLSSTMVPVPLIASVAVSETRSELLATVIVPLLVMLLLRWTVLPAMTLSLLPLARVTSLRYSLPPVVLMTPVPTLCNAPPRMRASLLMLIVPPAAALIIPAAAFS